VLRKKHAIKSQRRFPTDFFDATEELRIVILYHKLTASQVRAQCAPDDCPRERAAVTTSSLAKDPCSGFGEIGSESPVFRIVGCSSGLPPAAQKAKGGGEEGIRTLDTALDRITV
jgi:hypothetical protein